MESLRRTSEQSTITYTEWKNRKTSLSISKPQETPPIMAMAMATTAGVGGVRIYDRLFKQRKNTLTDIINETKKNTHHDVTVETEQYDEQTEYLLQARRDQEKDNETGDDMRLVPGMWTVKY
jgi:maltose-binding protein MalE